MRQIWDLVLQTVKRTNDDPPQKKKTLFKVISSLYANATLCKILETFHASLRTKSLKNIIQNP